MGLTKMAGPGSIWTKPGLAQIMQANHAAADAQEAHALEDIVAARERARARRRRPCLQRILVRLVEFAIRR